MRTVAAVYEAVSELEWRRIPLLGQEGWLRIKKKLRSHL